MAQTPQVQVVGLRALNRDLNKIVDDRGPLNKALAAAGKEAANPVAAATRSRMSAATTPARKPPHLTDDIRVTASRSGAAVRMGRSAIRWAGWVEFGGTRKVPHISTRKDGFLPQGRYLFPAALQLASVSARLYSEAVTEIFADYKWTNTGTDPGGVHD